MPITFRCDPALYDLLPRPLPARDALPDWLRRMAPRVPSPLHQRSVRTVKACPPFVDAMAHGFLIPLPCDVQVEEGGRFSWDWTLPPTALAHQPRSPLSFHVPEQLQGSPLAGPGRSALKFNSFWTIELDPGWSLMVVHPLNRVDLPFRVLAGRIDADTFHDVGINVPALWIDPAFRGTLPRGLPVAQCFAVPRDEPALRCEPMDAEQVQRGNALAERIMAGPGVYRRHFRAGRAG
jgi:hypothetical protein